MAFRLDNHWVWDFWLADDGTDFHLFYLHAPKSLEDPELRHRNARIGHATSSDLITWTDHGEVLGPGARGSFDETATWTGSVVRGDDGMWRMFYTGAVFAAEDSAVNVESIGVATSEDLFSWTKRDGFVLRADGTHYEKLGDTVWPEEAWRDPWVFRDDTGNGWHMLITARGKGGDLHSGGVVGHAWSPDLESWTVRPPLSAPATTFPHCEVFQLVDLGDREVLVFCGPRTDPRASRSAVPTVGVWAVSVERFPARVDLEEAELIAPAPYYAGRIVRDRSGSPALLAFVGAPGSEFDGSISDPMLLATLAS